MPQAVSPMDWVLTANLSHSSITPTAAAVRLQARSQVSAWQGMETAETRDEQEQARVMLSTVVNVPRPLCTCTAVPLCGPETANPWQIEHHCPALLKPSSTPTCSRHQHQALKQHHHQQCCQGRQYTHGLLCQPQALCPNLLALPQGLSICTARVGGQYSARRYRRIGACEDAQAADDCTCADCDLAVCEGAVRVAGSFQAL
jgi:hypothetical protein